MHTGIVNVILICTEIFGQHSIRINLIVKVNVEMFSLSMKKKLSLKAVYFNLAGLLQPSTHLKSRNFAHLVQVWPDSSQNNAEAQRHKKHCEVYYAYRDPSFLLCLLCFQTVSFLGYTLPKNNKCNTIYLVKCDNSFWNSKLYP